MGKRLMVALVVGGLSLAATAASADCCTTDSAAGRERADLSTAKNYCG